MGLVGEMSEPVGSVRIGRKGRSFSGASAAAERPPKRQRLEPTDPEAEIMRKLYVGNLPIDATVSTVPFLINYRYR